MKILESIEILSFLIKILRMLRKKYHLIIILHMEVVQGFKVSQPVFKLYIDELCDILNKIETITLI